MRSLIRFIKDTFSDFPPRWHTMGSCFIGVQQLENNLNRYKYNNSFII